MSIRSLPASIKEYMLTTRTSIADMPAFLREQAEGVQKMTLNFPEGEDNSFPDRGRAMEILDQIYGEQDMKLFESGVAYFK